MDRKAVIECMADAFDRAKLFSRYNDWTKDRVDGLPVEVCREHENGEPEVVARFAGSDQYCKEAASLIRHERMEAALTALEAAGFQVVPTEASREMLNAAIDVDSFKLGDISPLGFRCSPQQLFEQCYRAMLAAAKE